MSIEKVRLPYIEIFGLLGEALTTFGYIPQLLRILKLKSAREISLPFTLSFLVGAICWLTYGILLSLVPVILELGRNYFLRHAPVWEAKIRKGS
jgi:MtN3 and saliva related transmembrane protein